jgi:hypothetical protein
MKVSRLCQWLVCERMRLQAAQIGCSPFRTFISADALRRAASAVSRERETLTIVQITAIATRRFKAPIHSGINMLGEDQMPASIVTVPTAATTVISSRVPQVAATHTRMTSSSQSAIASGVFASKTNATAKPMIYTKSRPLRQVVVVVACQFIITDIQASWYYTPHRDIVAPHGRGSARFIQGRRFSCCAAVH